jgi:hypothetical protein
MPLSFVKHATLRATLTPMPDMKRFKHAISGTYSAARVSLSLCLVLSAHAGCLVTDVPDYEEPQLSQMLLFDPAPPTTEFMRIPPSQTSADLSAQLLSEDLGQNLYAAIIVDYGVPFCRLLQDGTESCEPWLQATASAIVDAGTLSGGPRTIPARWEINRTVIDGGCHSVTLLVTHRRKGSDPGLWCPELPNDYATLTWWAFVECSPDDITCETQECPTQGEEAFLYCSTNL